jgi:hypothetical protein
MILLWSSAMNLKAADQDIQQDFSDLVDRFIKRYCRFGNDLRILDRELFPAFRAYWTATAPDSQYPALLGQFRVELTERGFQSRGRKRIRWYGIALHELAVLAEKE